ncbi:MAG: HD domain-containing phosphohydrolase [Coriobacteriia bacterium]
MHVLIVDDDTRNRYLLRLQLQAAGHRVSDFPDATAALQYAREEAPDIIVSDILMPGMDGFALCREWKTDPTLAPIPFVFHTANYAESDDAHLANTLGADLFLTKPIAHEDLVAALETLMAHVAAEGARTPVDIPAEETFREHNVRLLHKLEQQLEEVQTANERLRLMINGTVLAIAKLVEARDPYTAGHQERVAALADAIGQEMGLSLDERIGIHTAGLIHDIGKISVPSAILSRPTRLSAPEFAIIKMHPDVAHDVLEGIDFPWPIADYVHQHHERMDGSGYPHGLAGDEILLGSRILAIADVVEAMTNHRPYKPAVGIDAALDEIRGNAGKTYDAEVAAACVRVFEGGFTLQPTEQHPGTASAYTRP